MGSGIYFNRKYMNFYRQAIFVMIGVLGAVFVQGQEFIPLYPSGQMPNSKGLKLTDSISNERIFRVGTPGMYAFFPSKAENKAAAVVICPGGGYERLAYVISGTQLAKWFNTMGVSAFVLNYRLPNSPDLKDRSIGPVQDVQRALKIIRVNGDKWGIDQKKVGIQGSSAGGHLAAMASVATTDLSKIGDSLDNVPFQPNFTILVSPVMDMTVYAHQGSKKNLLGENPSKELINKNSPALGVTSKTPPAFLVHAFNDNAVSVMNSMLYFESLIKAKVQSSLHIFPSGGHAIALRNNPGSTDYWTVLCESWMIETEVIKARVLPK